MIVLPGFQLVFCLYIKFLKIKQFINIFTVLPLMIYRQKQNKPNCYLLIDHSSTNCHWISKSIIYYNQKNLKNLYVKFYVTVRYQFWESCHNFFIKYQLMLKIKLFVAQRTNKKLQKKFLGNINLQVK